AGLLLLLLGLQAARVLNGEESVSADEVREKVEQQYKGKITSIEPLDDSYVVTLLLETGEYRLEVSDEDGRIIQMDRVKKTPEQGTSENEAEPETPAQPMTEEQAKELALERVSGTIDDVDYESSEDSSYFLVEIERENGDEATVQVNAITGEVMSVSWDD
ncbi:PepSY domain-containing protein, partial [Halobacillus sp. BBL2006]|uniref:PepSY domain-containing protein n=1 Tax=Halobacillus sp. BBL2006 TaxID=1543706 RepID=UPI00068E5FE6